MKFLLSLSLLFTFVLVADDHDAEMSAYEPNVAEYYVSTFKEGKDMDDMMRWAEKFNMWADETDHFENYIAALLVPYYHNGENPHDFVWVGISPNPEEMHKGNDRWFNEGTKLLEELNKNLELAHQNFTKSNDLKVFSNEVKASYGNAFDDKKIEEFSKMNTKEITKTVSYTHLTLPTIAKV